MLNYFANAAPNIIPVSEDKINRIHCRRKPAGQASANMGYSQYYGLTGGGGLSCQTFEVRVKVLVLAIMRESIQAAKAHICTKDIMLIDQKAEEHQ